MQKNTNTFSRPIKWTIFIVIIYRVIQLVVSAYNIYILQQILHGNKAFNTKLEFIINEPNVENTIGYFVMIPFIVSFSIWLYISYKNAGSTLRKKLSYGPTLSLFSLVIPIFNLFAPYKIMHEIWIVLNRDMSIEKKGKDLINMWWFLTIALICYSRYCNHKFEQSENLEDALNAEYLCVILF
jgi:hypothetical protein